MTESQGYILIGLVAITALGLVTYLRIAVVQLNAIHEKLTRIYSSSSPDALTGVDCRSKGNATR